MTTGSDGLETLQDWPGKTVEDTRKMVDDTKRNDAWSGFRLTVNLSRAFPTSATCFYVLPRLSGPGRVELWQEFCQSPR